MAKEVAIVEEFKMNLFNMEAQFKAALPKHIKSDKFLQVVVTAVRTKPELLKLDRQSLFNSCMDCAMDGLIPNGVLAALVPFKGRVKYMPMVAGICQKARNSGEILTIDAQVVYEKDNYQVWVDEKGPHFKHVKERGDRGEVLCTYAYALTKDGGVYHEEIDEEGMKAIEKCCNAKISPWKGPFKDEMRRKSVLRRLCKYRLPSSSDMDNLIRRDDDMYELDEPENEPKQEQTKSSSLEKAVSDEQVEDAEIKEEIQPEPEPEPKPEPKEQKKRWQTEGKIDSLTEKKGETKGKKWTKYGCKINGKWYGTFSSTAFGKMVEAKDQGCEVMIIFEEVKRGDKTVNDIVKIETIWPEENTSQEKHEVPNDEIPI